MIDENLLSVTFKKYPMPVYDNLIDALKDLKAKGYSTDFNIAFDNIQCNHTGKALSPAEFEIVAHYRFEADTDPDESSVLYVVESKDGALKGTLITPYGIYSDPISDTLIQKLKTHQ